MKKKFYNKKILIGLIFLFTIISCNKKQELVLNNKAKSFNKFQEEDSISFRNLINYKEGVPSRIFPIDTTLVIFNTDKKSKFLFNNYSLKKSTFSKGYLANGKGPNEVVGAMSAGVFKNSIWVYDITSKKILTTNKNNALSNNTFFPGNKYELQGNYLNMSFVDSLQFCAIGNWGSKSRHIVEKIDLISLKKNQNYGEYSSIDNIELETIRDVYSSTIFTKPSGGKIVLGYRHTDLIEIYNLKTKECIAVQGPEKYNVAFKQAKNNSGFFMEKSDQTRKAFINGAVTDNYIYMIYSGNKRGGRSDDDRFKWWYGKYIYVYDWNGIPVKKITLDRYIYTLGVSIDDKILYSYDLNTGYLLKSNSLK